MTRIIRFALLLFSLLLFITITPLVVLYATGYRLNFQKASPSSIGVLLLDTIPRRANVVVNGETLGRTPRAVSNLPPGQISVELKLAGFEPWQKNVSILPTLTTEFRSVRLFPTHPTQTRLEQKVSVFGLSPNNKLIAIVHSDSTIEVVDGSGQLVVTPLKLTFLPTKLVWSPDNASVLLLSDKRFSLFSLTNQTVKTLPLGGSVPDSFAWDTRLPNRLLYSTTQGQVIALQVDTGEKDVLVADAKAFALLPTSLAIASVTRNVIETYSFSGNQLPNDAIHVQKKIKSLITGNGSNIAVLFADNSLSFLSSDGLQEVANNVQDARWSPDDSLLYVKTAANEVYVYNAANDRLPFINKGEINLVARLSQPISAMSWFPDSQHLVYQINDAIIISEIDTRDHAITYQADTTNLGQAQAAVDGAGSLLYYLKEAQGEISLIAAQLLIE